MRVFLLCLFITLSSGSAWAQFGEESHSFIPDEYLTKSYIRAHEAVLKKRVAAFNKNGLKLLQEAVKGEDAKLIKTQMAHTRLRSLKSVQKRDHYYLLKLGTTKINFSAADLLLDRIYINGQSFDLNKKESLPDFQNRLVKFLRANQPKRTSFLNFIIPKAHALDYDLSKVEQMVVLNATGLVSITYEEPWSWNHAKWAKELAMAFTDELNKGYKECQDKTESLSKWPSRRIGDDLRKVLDSMKTEGNIDRSKVVSSLLKKFSKGRPVDPQSAVNKGD